MPAGDRRSPGAVAAARTAERFDARSRGSAQGEGGRGPLLELLLVAALIALFVPALLLAARQQVTTERSQVRLAIASDPSGASVIVDDVVVGRTPMTLELHRGEEIELRVEADEPFLEYDLYKPYRTRLTAQEERNLHVWIPRTTAEEQAAQAASR